MMNPKTFFANQRRQQLKAIIEHPYFGFIVIGLALMVVQVLYTSGAGISLTFMRSFGMTMIYVVVALGFSILLGYAGLASLGTAGFVGIGTYLLGYFTNQLQLSVVWIIVIAVLGAILIGLIVGFISLRIEGMYLAIITLGLSEILNEVFKNATAITNGTNGLGMDTLVLFGQPVLRNPNDVFVVLVIALVIVMIFTFNIIKSPTGRAMLSMKNSESAAQAMGVSIFRYRLLAFMVATVYAFFGGLLYMAYIGFSIPTSWSLAFSLNILAAVIVGGSRSIYGIILGTFMIFGFDMAVIQNIRLWPNNPWVLKLIENNPANAEQIANFFRNLQGAIPTMSYILNGLLIILVIMFYPGGLIQLLTAIKTKVVKWTTWLYQKVKVAIYGEDQ